MIKNCQTYKLYYMGLMVICILKSYLLKPSTVLMTCVHFSS